MDQKSGMTIFRMKSSRRRQVSKLLIRNIGNIIQHLRAYKKLLMLVVQHNCLQEYKSTVISLVTGLSVGARIVRIS